MIKLNRIYGLIFLFSMLLLPQTRAFAFSAAYEQRISVNGAQVANFKVYLQDKNMRVENTISGIPVVLLRNQSGTYNYIPSRNMAAKLPDSMQQPTLADDLPNFPEFLSRNQGTKVGSETVNGKECDVYTFMDPSNHQQAKTWVWKEKNFPLKFELNSPQGPTLVELADAQLDQKLDPTLFELPKDVQVTEVSPSQVQGGAQPPVAPEPPGKMLQTDYEAAHGSADTQTQQAQ